MFSKLFSIRLCLSLFGFWFLGYYIICLFAEFCCWLFMVLSAFVKKIGSCSCLFCEDEEENGVGERM